MVFPEETFAENHRHHGLHEGVEPPGSQGGAPGGDGPRHTRRSYQSDTEQHQSGDTVLHFAGGGQADAGAMTESHQSAIRNFQVIQQLHQIIGMLGQRQRTGAAITASLAARVLWNHTTAFLKLERQRPPVRRRLGRPVQEDNGRSAVIFAERFVMEAQPVCQVTVHHYTNPPIGMALAP